MKASLYLEKYRMQLMCVFLHFQILFLLSLGSNYQRIMVSKELTEYREAVNIELQDSAVLSNARSFETFQ